MDPEKPQRTALALLLLPLLVASPASAGYSHYFTWRRPPTSAELERCVPKLERLLYRAADRVAGPDGTGSPEITATSVAFNGRAPEEHEPFVFPGRDGFNACKTLWKPYDAVVTAALLVARDCFARDALVIASDGSWEAGDWSRGSALYLETFGAVATNPLDDRSGGIDMPWGLMIFESLISWLPLLAIVAFFLVFWRRQSRVAKEVQQLQEQHLQRSRAHMERVEQQLAALIEAVRERRP